MAAKILNTRTIHEGWGRFLMLDVRLDDGAEVSREMEDHGRAVAVLPYDSERRMALLVRLLRMGPLFAGEADPKLLEAPAGMIEEGDGPEETVRREALEEVGVRLAELEPVGAPFSSPGVSSERIDFYLAAYSQSDRVERGGGAPGEHENIEVVEMALADLHQMILLGELRDLKTIALTLLLQARRPDLFAQQT